MNKKAKRQIAAQIQAIAKQVIKGQPIADDPERLTAFGGEHGGFVLVNEAAVAYEQLYKRLVQDEGWGEKFSEDYVDKALRQIIQKLKDEGSTKNATAYFDELELEFETYAQEQIVYMVFAGIRVEIGDFHIGRFILRPLTDEFLEQLIARIEAIAMLCSSPPEVNAAGAAMQRQILERLKGTGMTYGEYHVVAEPVRAYERAEADARRVLDVLRYAIPACYATNLKVGVGLLGDLGRTNRLTPIISADNTASKLRTQSVGPLSLFHVSSENIQTMADIGALEISKLLEQEESSLSPFDSALLRAVHWFANAQVQGEQENELLSLVTALETFFTLDPGQPIADAVAKGVACVIGQDMQTQTYLYSHIKGYYNSRSRISHGGTKVILEADLKELRVMVGEVLAQLVKRRGEFKAKDGKKQLQAWVASHPFSKSRDTEENDVSE